MKQVKKLLVILPLVALFVLGSLPVLAADPQATYSDLKCKLQLTITDKDGTVKTPPAESIALSSILSEQDYITKDWTSGLDAITASIAAKLRSALENKYPGYLIKDAELNTAAAAVTKDGIDAELAKKQSEVAAIVLGNMSLTQDEKKAEPTPEPKPDEKPATSTERKLTVRYTDVNKDGKQEATRVYTLPADLFEKLGGTQYQQITTLADRIEKFVMKQLQDGYEEEGNTLTFANAAERFLTEPTAQDVTVLLSRDTTVYGWRVIAYDIHNNEFVYDRLYRLTVRPGFSSLRDVSQAFYDNSDQLKNDYLYAGFATRDVAPVLVYRFTYLEQIAGAKYLAELNARDAHLVTFVVPKTIPVRVEHIFPEGTRDKLIETVDVPYSTWAALQSSYDFMDLPAIFKTRIQKVNEQGFVYKEVKYFNGSKEIRGLLSAYDWIDIELPLRRDPVCARIYYDVAVAAAKEVPTEKKVDAASAPQAQIQAQGQAPVTAANTTTTAAPANTLPVTGVSDSIFLFLSSAALMAVGILFFKKH